MCTLTAQMDGSLRRVAAGALALLGAALVPSMGMAATPSPPAPVAPIRLLAATFVPTRGEAPDIPPGLTVAGYAPGQTGYYIVQFAGPVRPEWKSAVEAVGAELIDYLPDHAFKARMTPDQAAVVEAQPSVAWLGLFHPAYKISPRVDPDRRVLLRVRIEAGGDVGEAVAGVTESGAVTLRREGNLMLIMAAPGQAAAIARVLDVAWIEPFAFPVTHNDQAGGVIMGGSIANTRGYDGSTQIVAVADTGIGDGTPAGAHPDIPSGRVAVHDWPGPDDPPCFDVQPDGPQDVDSGHGTHTAVSAVGDGGPGGIGLGTAPAAGLVFQAIEDYVEVHFLCGLDNGYYLVGLPLDLRDLYQQAYGNEASFHSNSWGTSNSAGNYTTDSKNTDDFVFDNPGFLVTFSAGNDGVDADEDGVVDPGSLGSPATAKNVLAVGASEGLRPDAWPCDTGLTYASHDPYQTGTCSAMGGVNSLGTAGSRWGFAAEPLLSDVTAGDAEQMAPFSSRGPTDDMRIRPDVVAPGTWILSGYSGQYQEGYGTTENPVNMLYQWDGWGMPFDQDYKYMGGTSMSNPLAAGAAAVVADFYQKAHLHAASAALVKATLINSARDLLDENNDSLDDNDFPIPNIHEGWGIIDLDGATDGSHQYVDQTTGVGTSDSVSYQFEVATGGPAFKATLVWSDAPSTETASVNLVNDLDLVVTAPDGTTVYAGNNFVGGWSQPSMTPDQVNNVENVFVASAATGTWTVTVHGSNVPMGPQPFALVVDGDLTPPPVDVTPPVFSGVPDDVTVEATGPTGAIVTYTPPTATDLVDGTVAVNCLPASGSTFALGTATVTCTATDTSANTATAAFDVTVVDTTPPVISNVPDDVTVEATGPSGAIVSYTPPAASDLVEGPVAVACLPASGATFPVGITTVTCTATDTSANEATATFDVTVTPEGADVTPPVFSGVPDDVTVEATGPSGAIVSYTPPTATDLVDDTVAVNCLPASGSTFALGTATVTCTATDTSANEATATFDVTVADTTPPVISNVPDDMTVEATGPTGVTVSYTPPTAPDLVDGTVAVNCLPAKGTVFPIGTSTVTCTAIDTAANQAIATFDVTIADAPVGVLRYAGANRYGTASAISQGDFPDPESVEIVFVVFGGNFPDALAGAAVAARLGAPLLLVQADGIPPETEAELARLDPDQIVILGGTAVMSVEVQVALQGHASNVIRLAGPNRYATAVEISKYGFPHPDSADVVIVATGLGFADALAGGPAAAVLDGPVLLTDSSTLPGVVATEIARLGPSRIIVVGGTSAVSNAVFTQLQALAPDVDRIAGPNRYETAIAVSKEAFVGAHRAYVATGLNFPDALSGAAAAGWWGGPVLLVPGEDLPDSVADEVARLGANKGIILGGAAAVSFDVEDALIALVVV